MVLNLKLHIKSSKRVFRIEKVNSVLSVNMDQIKIDEEKDEMWDTKDSKGRNIEVMNSIFDRLKERSR